MEIEGQPPAEAVSAPELVPTAEPVPEVDVAPEAETVEQTKTFTQEELDAAVSKRLARERRKWEREHSAPQEQPVANDMMLRPEQFESTEAYVDALAHQRAQQLIQQQEEVRRAKELAGSFENRVEAFEEKFPDFAQVAFSNTHKVSEYMTQAIMASDVGPEIAYHLGLNPKESNRIADLPPLLQVKEIGKLEAKLAANPPVKKTSSAPAPISPVIARGAATALDTTNPKAAKDLSMEEWARLDNERVRAKLAKGF